MRVRVPAKGVWVCACVRVRAGGAWAFLQPQMTERAQTMAKLTER